MSQNGYQTARESLSKIDSKLLRYYDDAVNRLGLSLSDAASCKAVARIALATKTLYVDYPVIQRAHALKELGPFADIVHLCSRKAFSAGKAFVAAYPHLPYRIDALAADITSLIDDALAGLATGDAVLSYCLGTATAEQCQFFAGFFATIGRRSPAALSDVFTVMTSGMSGVAHDIFREWLSRGADLLSSGRTEEGIDYLLLRSRSSRALLGMPHVVIGDIKPVLVIYSSSVAHSSIAIQPLELSGFAITVPYTDGKTVYLPDTIGLFKEPEMNERAYTALSAQCSAMVSYGSYGFNFQEATFLDDLRQRYGTIPPEIMISVRKQYTTRARTIRERPSGEVELLFENQRQLVLLETPHEDFFYSFPTPELIRELLIFAENHRLKYLLGRRYPGLKEDFDLLGGRLAQRRREEGGLLAARQEQLEQAIDMIIRYTLTGSWEVPFTESRLIHAAEDLRKTIDGLHIEAATVQDSGKAAFELYNTLFENFPVIPYCNTYDIRRLFTSPFRPELFPEVVLEASPELLAERPVRPEFDDLEKPDERDIDLTTLSSKERKAEEMRQAIIQGALRIYRYPEYDINRASYRRRFCTVYESTLETGETETYHATLRRHRVLHKRLKKRFLALQPEDVEVSRRWFDGDEINLSDAVDYVTDQLRGETPDDRIYQRVIRNRRDIAAAILVDASSSTEEAVGEQRVIDIETTALALLGSVLSAAGDDFGIYTFFSMGRQNVFINILKDFTESWDPERQGRIDSVKALAANRDGCAVRHMTSRLLEQPNRTKLLILLSDGIPADAGYGGTSGAETTEYAIEDTRRAIVEARMQGIVPWCVTIDRTARSYIPRMYGDFHYTVVDDVQRLPEKLSKLYIKLTR